MHPEIQLDSPGKCPKCGGMDLVPQDSRTQTPLHEKSGLLQYKPLFIIVGLITLAACSAAWNGLIIEWTKAMQYFMAGFFFVFSGFKLLDIKGFAEGYSQYDLLAKRWHGYGLFYPFIELALGVGYILVPLEQNLHIITMVIMLFGGIGVSIKIAKHEKFQCACLGTFIDVPLTYITIIENFGMAMMAGFMIISG